MPSKKQSIEKISTGIDGFDVLAEGGLPKGRATVISGPPGSGKTIFGLEFLYKGVIEQQDNGVFVTFEERPSDLKSEVGGFGWDLNALEKKKIIAFVDASSIAEHQVEVGDYDFGALLARIKYAVGKVSARRVVIDGIASLFLRYRNDGLLRRELFRIIDTLRKLGVTTVITAERVEDTAVSSRFGVEDFVADSVVFLYNSMVGRERERQVEVVKLRGASHQTGRRPFIIGEGGITVFPGRKGEFAEDSPTDKLSIGIRGIDDMTSGGIYRGSTTMLLGPSGTGRTVLGMQFLNEGVRNGERGILFSFEEGPAQLRADAATFGWNFAAAEKRGQLQIVAYQPETMPLESYLKLMRDRIVAFGPSRIVIDSISPLAHAVERRRFRDFIVSVNSVLKDATITSIINYTHDAESGCSGAETDIAVLADNIIEMDFRRSGDEMERVITIRKSRASVHDKRVRRYDIDELGLCVLADGVDACLRPVRQAPKRPSRKAAKKRRRT